MKLAEHLDLYTEMAEAYLKEHTTVLSRAYVQRGVDAWEIAHRCGITRHAYALSRDILDAHIQTVLERVFPFAVFKDRKVY